MGFEEHLKKRFERDLFRVEFYLACLSVTSVTCKNLIVGRILSRSSSDFYQLLRLSRCIPMFEE
jgi:hypothetical protein